MILLSVKADFELQVLHTNDIQSRFEQTDEYGNMCPDSYPQKGGPCIGGFARLKSAVERFTKEAKNQNNIPSIFLNAGDTFQGSPYYSMYKSKIVAELIPYMGITAMSLGNHEFDDGVENLASFCNKVGITILAANLDFHLEPELEKCHIIKSTVLKLPGKDIGLIGYLTPYTKQLANTGKVIFKDEIEAIREEATSLKSRGINIIIALGHSGLEKDIEIAQKVPEISMIVGGHSHILFHSPKEKNPDLESAVAEYPVMVQQKSGRTVPIVHACCNTKYLGKLKVKFNDQGDAIETSGNTFLLDGSYPQDEGLKLLIQRYRESIKNTISVQLGRIGSDLSAHTEAYTTETDFGSRSWVVGSNFGNMVTDAFVRYAAKNYRSYNGWTDAAVALLQEGSIRTDINEFKYNGNIIYGDLLTALPFDNHPVKVVIKGSTIKAALEYSVQSAKIERFRLHTDGLSKYLYTSGIRAAYDLSKPAGNRVTSLYIRCANCIGPIYLKYNPERDENHTVIITDYLLNGGDGFNMFRDEAKDPKPIDVTIANLVADYIRNEQVVYPGYTGRAIAYYGGTASSAVSSTAFAIIPVISVAVVISFCQYAT